MRMLIVISYVTLLVAFWISVTAFGMPTGLYPHLSQGNLIPNSSLLYNLKFIWAYPQNTMHEIELRKTIMHVLIKLFSFSYK
jgi:hypothetical protein